ncbi:hypothetical protein [Vineibacter terrae]|uniref:hypothetical protein n=1 Tax=Vineibacter terrae TaxID=2586908 RepID=UPI002E3057C4|nr:hypothetical protein [Vineibacter terrae]HEX2888412.1 hypothetical protein [Vineibacter terrae]
MSHRVTAGGLAFCLALVVAPAMAQNVTVESDDAAYCKKLANLQSRYAGSANTSASLQTVTALNDCTNERAAAAIPQLEQRLRAAGFNLPERAVGARR